MKHATKATRILGIFFAMGLIAGLPAPTLAQGDAPLHLNFIRPPIESVVEGPLPGLLSPGFDIIVNFPDMSLTPSQQAAFTTAETFWEGVISGYRGTIMVTSVTIDADAPPIDGPGGILGGAGPTTLSIQEGFVLPTGGSMSFDSADVAALEMSGQLGDVIRHEMGHVLGIGTLWTCNPHPNTVNDCGLGAGPATPNYVTGSGEFVGPAATARWIIEFGQAGTPDVELGGGPGTANGHWNEVDLGAGLTGITDGMGNDMTNELMTGWLNAPTFLSEMTLASLYDNGYTTIPATPVTLQSFSVD